VIGGRPGDTVETVSGASEKNEIRGQPDAIFTNADLHQQPAGLRISHRHKYHRGREDKSDEHTRAGSRQFLHPDRMKHNTFAQRNRARDQR
jgi:hypothetical protein